MKKQLLHSHKSLIDFLLKEGLEEQDIENYLGIEFAFEDGTYHDDWIKGIDINEDQDTTTNIFRIYENNGLPIKYPCIIVLWHEKTFDRFGDVKILCYDYVYLDDFWSDYQI